MKKILFTLLAITAGSMLCAAVNPVYNVRYSAIAPELDGNLNDAAWRNIPWCVESFSVHRKKIAPQNATRFKALYTNDALYLGIECMEKDIGKLKKVYNFGEFWNYDTVEVFFAPRDKELIQLISNYESMKQDNFQGGVGKRTGYKTGWLSAGKISKNSWCVEICVPFFLLGKAPITNDTVIKFNLCRTSISADERSTWSFQDGPFKKVKNFGRLNLVKVPASIADALKTSLSRPHWSSMYERWKVIRKDVVWQEIFSLHKAEYAELEKLFSDKKNFHQKADRFYHLLSTLEKFSAKRESQRKKEIMKRLFGE
jgi:hypothetical protein